MSELKPCPFCGGLPKMSKHNNKLIYGERKEHRITCEKCFISLAALSDNSELNGENKVLDRLIKAWNTRAVPDVPELVRYDFVRDYVKTCNGFRKRRVVKEFNDGKYVLYSQAAEIIAADRAEKHRAQEAVLKLERELAQYEAQEPVAWRHPEAGWTDVSKAEVAVHCKHGTQPQPLYASPAPAADLKAENQKLREALETEEILSDRLASALEYIDDYSLSYPDLGTISAVAQPALEAHEVARAALNVEANDGL